MSAEGAAGGLLIIGGSPGRREDDIGRPFMSESSVFFRKLVERSWSGPVAYDYAVRCCPGSSEAMVHAPMCRRYLAATFGEVQPSRVLLLGRLAALAVTGRSPSPLTVRGGYTWLAGDKPVFFLQDPADATRNRFHRQWMEEDVRVALPGADTMSMPPWRQAGHVVETAEDAQEAATALRSAPWFAFDTETAGKMWRGPFQVLCLACSAASSDTSWIWGPAALTNPDVLSPLVQLLIDPSVAKVGQNIKYDLAALRLGLGISVRGVRDDTRLLRKMLYSDADGSLEIMAELIGMGGHKAEAQGVLADACSRVGELARQNEQAGRTLQLDGLGCDIGLLRPEVAGSIRYGDEPLNFAYGLLPEDLLLRYCCRDTISTARLNLLLERQAQADDPGITRVYRQVLMPASDAVHQVERWGMPVSKDAVQQFHTYLTMAKGEMLTRIKSHGGVDPDSTQDIGRFLYKDLGLKVETTTPTGKPSTSAEALEDMRDAHPVVGEILDYRRLVYLDGNHAAGLLPHICLDGRIHPTLLLDGARTGRFSCSRPNLHGTPRDADSPEGKMARQCFAAGEGKRIISADYSQLELRVAAMLSGDPVMTDIFRLGGDIHLSTAKAISQLVWGVPPSAVEKRHRSAAKAFVFGVIYGLGDKGIATRAGCTVTEARKIRAAIMGKFKVLADWIPTKLDETRRTGAAWTWWEGQRGRRRSMDGIADPNDDRRIVYEHGAFNSPIQGTGSEYLVASLSAIVAWVRDNGIPAVVCVPVHDSVILEVEESAVDEVAANVKRIMLSWASGNVPLEVDVDVGPTWGDLQKWVGSARPAQVHGQGETT